MIYPSKQGNCLGRSRSVPVIPVFLSGRSATAFRTAVQAAHTRLPLTAGPWHCWPERFERAEQRGATFKRAVSNLAICIGRNGLMTAI
jgi:hypothetical protein